MKLEAVAWGKTVVAAMHLGRQGRKGDGAGAGRLGLLREMVSFQLRKTMTDGKKVGLELPEADSPTIRQSLNCPAFPK